MNTSLSDAMARVQLETPRQGLHFQDSSASLPYTATSPCSSASVTSASVIAEVSLLHLNPQASVEGKNSVQGVSNQETTKSTDDANVTKLRSMLPPKYQDIDSNTIRRFIAATNGNLAQSAKRLAATCAWREQHKPEQIQCKACMKNPKSHYMHIIGHDSLQRPIIYSCLAAAKNKVYADNHDHMIQTFEMAIRCMPPGVQNWVWACDFHGFGVSDLNPALAKAFLDVSATHYPERLGLFLVIDAPSLFGILWKAIQSFVDPKTYTKIRFLPYDLKSPDSKLRACLKTFCEPDMVEWICTEMQENRDNKKLPGKVYNMQELHRSASMGSLEPSHAHDNRGHAKLLRMYTTNPSLLDPSSRASSPAVSDDGSRDFHK